MRLLTALILLTGSLFADESRTWTNTDGQQLEAALTEIQGDSVVLKLNNGTTTPYPLAKLSEADQAYVQQQVEEQKNTSPDLNFDDPWPEKIKFQSDPEITIVEENADENRYIYESANYRFICDARLSKSVVNSFSDLFEATYLFCRTIPLALDGGKNANDKFPILLFEKFEDYVKAGGPPQSAGVYIGGKGIIMVPLSSLGVESVGRRYIVNRHKSSKTLAHEIVHQLTPPAYYRAAGRGWFTEGLANYIAVTRYRHGTYNVKYNHKDIIDYVVGYGTGGTGGMALGEEIPLPPLKTFMLQSYGSFLENSRVNYGAGLLITYYFLQLDGDGEAKRIKAFLKGLRQGKEREEALEILLDGRSYEQLEKEIIEAWGKHRIDITFGAK